ncbi:MAG: InlB B-repeat-containing protein [Acholeplasmatales bacterium]|nr:InlB B-repeat-containing protein [Acholeplasmatales bacterium]
MKKLTILGIAGLTVLSTIGLASCNKEITANTNNQVIEEPSKKEEEEKGTTRTIKYYDGESLKLTWTVQKGETTLELDGEAKDGYKFMGWYLNENDENQFDFNTPINKSINLHAVYKKILTAKFLVNNTEYSSVDDLLEGSKLEEIDVPYKHKYIGKWLDKDGKQFDFSKELTENVELHASYEAIDTTNLKKSYVDGKMPDFSKYENTNQYVQVSTADELVQAIEKARDTYTTTWNDSLNDYTQEMKQEGTVSVIEITSDINLGYNKLSSASKSSSVTEDYNRKNRIQDESRSGIASDMLLENGITKLKIENINGLKIFSKNGAKLTHGGFSIGSSSDIEISNLKMDEMWQWEDASSLNPNFTVGDYDVYGWAYMKISNSTNVYVHNCTFGKSYDGQIDISDTNYWINKAVSELRAPYTTARESKITISECKFNENDTSTNGYIYKMMKKIDDDYTAKKGNSKYKYYYTLRNNYNLSFDDIMQSVALPQKKAFLIGDRSDYGVEMNKFAHINFDSCTFTDIEDRLPKVRSGFVYMSNCLYDNSNYWKAHEKLEKLGVKNINNTYKKFKCALVSQGIVISQDADVIAENCVFIGIKELIKNNENDSSKAGFMLVNCLYDATAKGNYTKLDTSNNPKSFIDIKDAFDTEFNFHNEKNELDILPIFKDVNKLKEELKNIGAK